MLYSKNGIVVIGAGIVGTCLALYLVRAGKHVTLIDSGIPGGGASYGNAGQISPDTCTPDFIPGVLRNIPRWLADPLGPLAVQPSYLARALPWLVRSARTGRLDIVLRNADAIRSIHKDAFACYRELLGGMFDKYIKLNGQVYFWQDSPGKTASIRETIAERVGAVMEPLPLDELQKMVPSLTRSITKAVLMANNGNTVNAYRLVQALADEFSARGGVILSETVMKILPESEGFRLITNISNHKARQVAICAGAFSQRLLKPLGYRLPLETERGYHVTIAEPNIEPPSVPVICIDRPAAATPLDSGLRCAGTVEFAGLDSPMNERRAQILLQRVKSILPGLNTDEYTVWMGHRPSFPDSLPVIEQSSIHPGLFLCFGHGMAGMTGGPPSARALSDLMLGHTPSLSLSPFQSSRF